MAKKITTHYIRLTAWVVAAAAALSAASYFVTRPAPVYEGGKLILTARFTAHDNGFPLTYIHNTCFGIPLVCHQYFDWWAFAANTLFLSAIVVMAWFTFKHYVHMRKHH